MTYAHDELGSYAVVVQQQRHASRRSVLPLRYHRGRPCWRPTPPGGHVPSWCRFRCIADVQHILTDPEDGEALRIDGIKSVNLSEPIGEGGSAYMPMGDSRRRSYIATARGNQSVEHLIALARAHLLKRSRVVEISFAPKLARMPEITLRKNAFMIEPRIGEALGKIIGYTLALDGADGRINCEVKIGCAIGRGGSQIAAGGNPTYCGGSLYRRRLSAIHRAHRCCSIPRSATRRPMPTRTTTASISCRADHADGRD